MSVCAQQGYVTDVEYTGDFYAHLSPAWMAYIAAVNGFAAPRLDGDFTWCELGCGKGVTAVLLAATHPRGDFHACDFNARHIEYGEALRVASGVRNLRLYPSHFSRMLEEDLPHFDFVALHGVYSWVPEPVREEIHAFLRAKLKPGGLAMVSYNAMPGWAHLLPVRRLMRDCAETVPGDSLAKARAAFAYASAMAEAGAGFFATLPAAAAHLGTVAGHDIRYVAHEYMTPHGKPFYFIDVEKAMLGCGLAYAGCMNPPDNYAELMMPAKFLPLAPSRGRSTLQSHRDFVMNTGFRQDLYASQPAVAQMPQDIGLDGFAGLAFALQALPEQLPLTAAGELAFDLGPSERAVRAVHSILERGPAGPRAIRAALGAISETECSFLIQQLVVARHIVPCAASRASTGWSPAASAMVEAGLRDQLQQVPLACPATGSATYVEVLHAASIEAAARQGDAYQAGQGVLAHVRRLAHPVNLHDESGASRTASDEEIVRYVASTWRRLRDPGSPEARLLRLLGVFA